MTLVAALLTTALALAPMTTVHAAAAEGLQGAALVEALRAGGLTLVMRHAKSPSQPPDSPASDNAGRERELDDAGQRSATAFGLALRLLRIPVGDVYSSPTYRALQTARLAQLPTPKTRPELGDGGQNMQADAGGKRGEAVRALAALKPAAGRDNIVITHVPNLREAFGAEAGQLEDGEALVVRADGQGGLKVLAHVPIDVWPMLSATQ